MINLKLTAAMLLALSCSACSIRANNTTTTSQANIHTQTYKYVGSSMKLIMTRCSITTPVKSVIATSDLQCDSQDHCSMLFQPLAQDVFGCEDQLLLNQPIKNQI